VLGCDIVRVGAVGIATRYGLGGPGIEVRWGEIFRAIQTGPEAHPASCSVGTGSFSGIKRHERDANHPSPSRAGLRMGRSYTPEPT